MSNEYFYPRDRRLKYPPAVRLELARLFAAGWSARRASIALGLPLTYAASRFHAWRARHSDTLPNPDVVALIQAVGSQKEASNV